MARAVKYQKYVSSLENIEKIKREFIIAHNKRIKAKKRVAAVNDYPLINQSS